MNKFLISALVLSSALAAPALAFAQSNGPVTRAQVRAELIQLEKAGYTPGGEDVNYPQDIQAASPMAYVRASGRNKNNENSSFEAPGLGNCDCRVSIRHNSCLRCR